MIKHKQQRVAFRSQRSITSLYLARYTLSGSIQSSKPNVAIAHNKSSPLIVFLFSFWHLSLALQNKKPQSDHIKSDPQTPNPKDEPYFARTQNAFPKIKIPLLNTTITKHKQKSLFWKKKKGAEFPKQRSHLTKQQHLNQSQTTRQKPSFKNTNDQEQSKSTKTSVLESPTLVSNAPITFQKTKAHFSNSATFQKEHLSIVKKIHTRVGIEALRTNSLVIKLINSETHSWTVSLASLAIFPFAGKAFFMILLILAIGRYLSCSLTPEWGLCSPPLSWLPPAGLVGLSAISTKSL